MADIIEMIQSNDLLKVLLILGAVYLFMMYMKQNKKPKGEQMQNTWGYVPAQSVMMEPIENVDSRPAPAILRQGAPPPEAAPAPTQQQQMAQVLAGTPELDANDLLPQYDEANEFAKQNPVSNLLKEQNFLVSGYHVGVNTVMQSNKIPFHDLRAAPPIPKENVGPWMQSSFEQPAGSALRPMILL